MPLRRIQYTKKQLLIIANISIMKKQKTEQVNPRERDDKDVELITGSTMKEHGKTSFLRAKKMEVI